MEVEEGHALFSTVFPTFRECKFYGRSSKSRVRGHLTVEEEDRRRELQSGLISGRRKKNPCVDAGLLHRELMPYRMI